ncbi:MAG: DUF4363 family protein [Clostridia bacterium]
MKQFIIFIVTLIILIFGGIKEIDYIKNTAVYTLADLEYTKNSLNNDKFDLAYENAKDLKNTWTELKKIWQIFINHSEIDEVDSSVTELISYILSNDKIEAMAKIDLLQRDFNHIVENQKVNIQNIF